MKWISVKEKKPPDFTEALVYNEKGWMRDVRAIYHAPEDVWVLYAPDYRERVTLEVSHYIPIPECPRNLL